MDYEQYIISVDWMYKRQEALYRDGYKCCLCGRNRELEVHHLTYERLGNENLEDLMTLCVRCYNDAHYFENYEEVVDAKFLQQKPITHEEYEKCKQMIELNWG